VGSNGWDVVQLLIINKKNEKSKYNIKYHNIDSLSSGEAARLALALEACSHDISGECNMDDATSSISSYTTTDISEPLVVYDEIDAHVGGEAAAAVARLLKKIGKYRQVLAITHSPVVAAAADRHFVVTKHNNEEESNNSNLVMSTVSEVYEKDREREIARMATGRLATDAGLQLAQKLLTLDFSSTTSSLSPNSSSSPSSNSISKSSSINAL
jgi:DNA repair ATPase RecN